MFRKKQGGGDADDVNVTYKAPFPIEGAAVENGGRKYRLAGKKECLAFRNYADSIDGFTERYNKRNDVIVWTKKIKDEPLHLVKVFSIYPGVAPETMYDMLQDSVYRAIWDTHRIHAFCIAQLDSNNDIGYYAARSPVPGVAHRDFVNQRSWRSVGDGEFVIFNTSVPHRDVPLGYLKEKKITSDSVVRGFSKITGYLIRPWADGGQDGCCLTYITHCNPAGWIPSAVINYISTKASPNTVKVARDAAAKFDSWLEEQDGYQQTWLQPEDPFDVPVQHRTVQLAKELWQKDGHQSKSGSVNAGNVGLLEAE